LILKARDNDMKLVLLWFGSWKNSASAYAPDLDNGGNGEMGSQQMIMQVDGKKILLLPAWPKE
jgi:alpha-L-fucosidase 2